MCHALVQSPGYSINQHSCESCVWHKLLSFHHLPDRICLGELFLMLLSSVPGAWQRVWYIVSDLNIFTKCSLWWKPCGPGIGDLTVNKGDPVTAFMRFAVCTCTCVCPLLCLEAGDRILFRWPGQLANSCLLEIPYRVPTPFMLFSKTNMYIHESQKTLSFSTYYHITVKESLFSPSLRFSL